MATLGAMIEPMIGSHARVSAYGEMVDLLWRDGNPEAAIRLDGDWAEVSVPRCSGNSAGADELRLLYFEERWRFIYTDLFDGSSSAER